MICRSVSRPRLKAGDSKCKRILELLSEAPREENYMRGITVLSIVCKYLLLAPHPDLKIVG